MIKAIQIINVCFTGKGEIKMKKKRKLFCFLLSLSLIFTMTFGSVSVSAAPKLNKTKVTLLKGEKTTLKVTGTKQKVTWSSSKKSVATVNSKGQVVAKNKGSATILAKVSKKTYKCVVKVETPKLSKTSLTLTEKKSYAIKLTGTTVKVKYSSSNPKIACVDSRGKITAVKKGNAVITAKANTKKFTCKVTVKAAQKLTTLQQKYDENRQLLQEKEDKISTNLFIIIALCILTAILAAALVFLAALLFKHIRQVKKLKHSLGIANENNEQKSRFISNISTQIEPTLNTMEEATEVFSAKILQKNIEALKKLMTDIQTYVTLEETREEHYPLKDMNINAFCETIMEKAKANFKPEVEAVLNVPRVNIKTNAEALERILLYLLRNAALHTDNGKITLEFKKRSAHTGQFIITDTGTGIPTEIKGKLFKPFAEIHDLTQGNGLGLPTCSLIAYKLNGTLHLDNEYKKGTRFVLELHDK